MASDTNDSFAEEIPFFSHSIITFHVEIFDTMRLIQSTPYNLDTVHATKKFLKNAIIPVVPGVRSICERQVNLCRCIPAVIANYDQRAIEFVIGIVNKNIDTTLNCIESYTTYFETTFVRVRRPVFSQFVLLNKKKIGLPQDIMKKIWQKVHDRE